MKKLTKTIWYGSEVDSNGNPTLPRPATSADDLEGLHHGELYLHLGTEVTLWSLSSNGEVVCISGKGEDIDLSGYLLKSIWDKVFEIKTDSDGQEYLFGKLPLATQYGITMYADGGELNLPTIYDGLPIDNSTIYWEDGVLKAVGGGGTADAILWENVLNKPSWIGSEKPSYSYSEISGTPDLSGYLTSITSSMIIEALGYTPFDKANFTKANIKSTLGIYDWALASVKPTYKFSEIINKPTTLSGYGITNAYTDTEIDNLLQFYVTTDTEQTITAKKNFTGGLSINGNPIVYNPDVGYWKLEGDLLVSGGVTMFASDSAFTPSTIMDAVAVDGVTIVKENGKLVAIGGGSGSGVADSVAWENVLGKPSWIGDTKPAYAYAEIANAPSSLKNPYAITWSGYSSGTYDGSAAKSFYIPSKLSEFTNDSGFITSSALSGYQTKITSSNKLPYTLISDTPDLSVYAQKSNTLSGYGITDAYTKTETSDTFLKKATSLNASNINYDNLYSSAIYNNTSGNGSGNTNAPCPYGLLFVFGSGGYAAQLSVASNNNVKVRNRYYRTVDGVAGMYWTEWTTLANTSLDVVFKKTLQSDGRIYANGGLSVVGSTNLSGALSVTGATSVPSLKVNGGNLTYDSRGYWKLEGDLLVTGGVTMYANEGTYTPSTIMDGVLYDDVTIGKNSAGQLYVKGDISGGIDTSELSAYLLANTFVNSVTTSGSGNAVTSASISGNKLTLTKGATYLTSSGTSANSFGIRRVSDYSNYAFTSYSVITNNAGTKGEGINLEWHTPYGQFVNGTTDYGQILRFCYSSKLYYTDLFVDANNTSLAYRKVINGVNQGWRYILDSNNYATYTLAKTNAEYYGIDFNSTTDDDSVRLMLRNSSAVKVGVGYAALSAFFTNYVTGKSITISDKLYFANNIVLDASNYGSYALPLSGGTLTGSLASVVNTTNGVSHRVTNSNGSVGIHVQWNQGLYDFSNGVWLVGSDRANTWFALGNVGFGTTSPSYKAHIEGTLYASGATKLGSTLSVSGTSTFTGSVTANSDLYAANGLTIKSGNTYSRLKIFSSEATSAMWIQAGSYDGSSNSGTLYLSGINGGNMSNLYLKANTTTISSVLNVNGATSVPSLKVNGGNLTYDATNKYFKLEGDLLVTGGVTMFGNEGTYTPTTIMDGVLYDDVTIGRNSSGQLYVKGGSGGMDTSELAAYLLANKYTNTISITGSGNAITSVSQSGSTLTFTKGATYLTAHQTIYNLTLQAGTFSAATFDPNGAAKTINIPTTTAHIAEGTNLYFTNARALAAITGGASSIKSTNLSTSRALVSDANGKVAVSAVTSTELGYLDGVTSAIQTQLNNKAAKSTTLSGYGITNAYTKTEADAKYLPLSGGTITGLLSIVRTPSVIAYFSSSGSRLGYLGFGGTDNPIMYKADSSAYYSLLHSNNYNSYAPTLTGTGASGTWGININGTAAIASTFNSTSKTSPNEAYNADYSQWFTLPKSSDNYAGNNYGFPVSNNANGILWLRTHENPYGGQLGISSNGRMYYRFITNNTFPTTANGGSWNKIAWVTDNVASATKLETARTIWGQSFNGTANVSGAMSGVTTLNASGAVTFGSTLSVGGKTTLSGGLSVTGAAYFGGGSTYYFGSSGNVKCNTLTSVSSATLESLNVSGASKFTGTAYFGGGTTYYFSSAGNVVGNAITANGATSLKSTLAVTGASTFTGKTTHNGGLASTTGSFSSSVAMSSTLAVNTATTIGSTTANNGTYALYLSGSAYISSNLLTGGGITMYSQRSLKNIMDERGLSLAELSVIKPIRYTWKDKRDDRLHIGGIADDILKVMPEVVYKVGGTLSMDYSCAGFAIAASLIKPVSEHEKEITLLKKRVRELEQELEQLKSA